MSLFKSPTEKDVSGNGKLTPAQTVRALFSAQWGFYKYGYDTMLKIAAIEFVIIVILSLALLFLAASGVPEPKFFAVNAQRQITEILPLSEQRISDNQVRQFATDALLESLNFTYDDYNQRIENAADYFTDEGFTAFKTALKDSRVFDQLKEKQLLMRTVITSVPEIDKANSKNYGGTHIWVLNVTTKRTLTDRAQVLSVNYSYRIFVRQVPFTERPLGMAIYSIKQNSDQQNQ